MTDIPKGYKQTEVGVIPKTWDVQPLSQTIERLEAGVSVNSVEDNLTDYSHNHAVLKTSAVTEGKFLPRECKKIAPRDLKRVRLSPRVDTILISRMNTPDLVGECGYVDRDYDNLFLPDRLWMTKRRSGSDASIRWLSYLLSSMPQKTRIKELATGTSGSMKNLAKGAFLELQIAVPPPPEQRAIAAALSDVDALLGSLDRLIAKKRDLKQAAMQQLLTGKRRLLGFHGEWDVKWLGDLFNFSGGYSASRDQLSQEGHCYLHYGDIHKSSKTFINVSAECQDIPKLDIPLRRVSANSLLNDGDVVFVDASEDDEGTSKHIVVINKDKKPFISGLHTIIAKSKTEELDHGYRRYCFQTKAIRDKFLFYSVGTKVSGISKSNIPKLTLPVPPVTEQAAIAAVLSDMDAELAALEQRRDKTRALKQAMMQELLTGRIRLA